jgi:hypothetical protein
MYVLGREYNIGKNGGTAYMQGREEEMTPSVCTYTTKKHIEAQY